MNLFKTIDNVMTFCLIIREKERDEVRMNVGSLGDSLVSHR